MRTALRLDPAFRPRDAPGLGDSKSGGNGGNDTISESEMPVRPLYALSSRPNDVIEPKDGPLTISPEDRGRALPELPSLAFAR